MREKIKTYILIQHKVKDFTKWKKLFDQNDMRWHTAGLHLQDMYRSADNENEVTMIFEVEDLLIMQVHLESAAIFERMHDAGLIVGEVKFDILERVI